MNRWVLCGVGFAVYAVALIAMAPAAWLDTALRDASQGRLRLAEAQGSLWAGSGRIELRDADRTGGIARAVTWHLRPAYLLRGRLQYEIRLGQAGRPFPLSLGVAQVEVSDADLQLPAAALAFAEPRLVPLELTGDLTLHIDRLAVSRSAVGGSGTLQWLGAGSALTQVSPLGDYELRAEDDRSGLRLALRTLRGPLQLDGQGAWTPGSRPQFAGTARVPPEYQQQLSPLLRLIAIDRGGGSFLLQLR